MAFNDLQDSLASWVSPTDQHSSMGQTSDRLLSYDTLWTELGITEIAEGRTDAQRQVVASGGISTSQFRAKWQGKKPEWLCAFLAEALGVWFFTIAGAASTASFIIGEGAGIELSSFLQIGLTYAIGIALAINTAAMTSGGHFHPAVSM